MVTTGMKENYIGPAARTTFYNMYRHNEYERVPRPPSPRSTYFKKCDVLGITPEPMGVIRQNDAPVMRLGDYKMGERVAAAFADALSLVSCTQK